MSAKRTECRWGILGCGPEAASFVAEIQAGRGSTPTASELESSQYHHTIIAISSNDASTSRAFADSHIRTSANAKTTSGSAASPTTETFGTSTELHAHPSIDSIFIASPQHTRYQEALSALRGGKSVLISKPLAMSSSEASELCELASKKDKDKVKWLGFVMRTRPDKEGLLWAADECAKGRESGQEQSPLIRWADSLAVLEALDEVREAGGMRLSIEADTTTSFPRMKSNSSSSAAASSPAEQKRRLSVDTSSRRPASRASLSSDAAQEENLSTATLRAQLHELRHVLRQKNALITSLEQRGGQPALSRPKAGGRSSLPAQTSTSLSTPLTATTNRRRTSSLDQTSTIGSGSDDDLSLSPGHAGMPLADVINTVDSSRSDSPFGRRKRKDANGGRRSATPDRSASASRDNSLGLSTVREGNSSSNLTLGEGFLAPTVASENRRIATTGGPGTPRLGTPNGMSALGSPILSPGGGGKGTGKVIESLTMELSSSKTGLEDAKAQLRTSQRSILTLQRSLDEVKETLGRSRSENETLAQMMTRKDRQFQEALERARKAEAESKELGKSSREWGARVRKVEAELGEERMHRQKAEMHYEAISTSWKHIREEWEKEMKELRESHGDAVKKKREDVNKMLGRFRAAEESWRGREEEGKVMRGIIKELEMERNRAATFIEGPIKALVAQLVEHEKHTDGQDLAVEEVQKELKRIVRLMRSHPT